MAKSWKGDDDDTAPASASASAASAAKDDAMPDDGGKAPATSPGEGAAVAVPDLEALKSKIESMSNQIRDLKAAGDDESKDKVPALVQELLRMKKEYADNNDGIGVDGKKYEPPMSKSEKKKLEKAKKKAAAAAAAGGGEGGGAAQPQKGGEPGSKGSQKKAAKKAEAKAKKAAIKAAQKDGGAAGGASPPKKGVPPASAAPRSVAFSAATTATTTSKLRPNQLSFNPNVPLSDRPVAALTVAVLLDGAADVEIIPDHTRLGGPAFGLPSSSGGGEICGDVAIARYFARTMPGGSTGAAVADGAALLCEEGSGPSAERRAALEQWVDYALTVSKFPTLERRVKAVGTTLNAALARRTYACGTALTLADLALYAAMGFPSQAGDAEAAAGLLGGDASAAPALRWMNMLSTHPAVREATQLALGVSHGAEAAFEGGPRLDPLVEGMSTLEGATPGCVVTRFPPEPSGYLHIGHAKAVLLNDYYARRYKGRLIVRFDDTNPSKEKEEFQSSILEDLGRLGVKADLVTYTSDYFETMRGYAERMIAEGMAYMDDTPQEQMQKERMDRTESARRGQSPQEAMDLFKLMCSGSEEGAKWCLRVKIDMSSVNGTMRDPVIYRQNLTPHHRSGTTYKAYPTYDLACPIVDSIEGVTHALRTTEYNDRDEQYYWIQRALRLRRVRIHAFARVNFMHTVLSKRKLTWFVNSGHVTGWDDARFPTVRGVVRRGIDIGALRAFMCAQGASRRVVNMEWSKFWADNKRYIDAYAKRFMAIDRASHTKMIVTNGPDADGFKYVSADYHPKDPSMGKRIVRIAKEVLLESVDAEGLTVGEDIVLMRWGVVKVTKVDGGLEGEHIPDGDFKAAKKRLSWIASVPQNIPCVLTEFDNLISKEKLEEDDKFEDFINPRTMAETEVIGDAMLKTLREHDIIQLERRGYYRVDRPYLSDDKPLVLYMIPDGKSKPMSGLAGQLKHS